MRFTSLAALVSCHTVVATTTETTVQPKTGSSDTNYNTGGTENFRGDETEATGYGTNDRDAVASNPSSGNAPGQLTGIPYTNATIPFGAFATASGSYGVGSTGASIDMTSADVNFKILGHGECQISGATTATPTTGTGATTDAECAAMCAKNLGVGAPTTTCGGYRFSGASCSLFTEELMDAGEWDGTGTKPAPCMKKIGSANNADTITANDGCSAHGFICDFREVSKMGAYKPQDFIWKIVDPRQRYSKEDATNAGITDAQGSTYNQQTLNCQVKITLAFEAPNMGGAPDNNDWFFVPTGQENVGSSDYCDIEGIRRDFKDDELYMNDTIHIRGETARVSNVNNAEMDLIGEFFDLICGCMTRLSTEATLLDGLKQANNALLTVMTATGQERELGVSLILFSDDALTNQIVFPQTFPDNSQFFFLLARHLADNDWDAKLQINKCVACDLSDDCQTSNSAKRVVFYEGCKTILGGPNERMIASSSWFHDSITAPPTLKDGTDMKPNNQWADADPTTCPYAAKGFQKFRLADRSTMQITCAVTACESLPCPPCAPRRSLMSSFSRQLQQQQNEVDVTMYMGFGGNDMTAKQYNVDETENSEQKKKSQGAVFWVLIVLLLLAAAVSAVVIRKMMKRSKDTTKRQIRLGGEESAAKA